MNKKFFFLIFTIVAVTDLFSQNGSLKLIPSGYCTLNGSPLLFTKGDTIRVSCDSIYIMSTSRYAFYKSIHKTIAESDKDSVCTKLLSSYEKQLIDRDKSYNKLLENSKQAEKVTQDLIDYSQKSLAGTQKTLEFTQATLDQSLKSIDLAQDYVQKAKWNSKGQKLLTGICGVGIGLLVGVLIMK